MKALRVFFTLLIIWFYSTANAQFISQGTILYEVKTNMKKALGNSSWVEGMKDKLPTFKSSFFKLSFSDNRTQYVFERYDDKDKIPPFLRQNDEKSAWDHDFEKSTYLSNKELFGTLFSIRDSIPKIKWKLSNENRIIAGFNCRKASGIIMDSVYVFAFYTDEITTPGGPATINGLPGMILGVTIPRLYTSFIAKEIVPMDKSPQFLKQEESSKIFNRKSVLEAVKKSTSGWGSDENADNYYDQLYWNLLL
jgi:GLPGLI family protein